MNNKAKRNNTANNNQHPKIEEFWLANQDRPREIEGLQRHVVCILLKNNHLFACQNQALSNHWLQNRHCSRDFIPTVARTLHKAVPIKKKNWKMEFNSKIHTQPKYNSVHNVVALL